MKTTTSNVLVELTNIHKSFTLAGSPVPVLQKVSLSIQEGEMVAIYGKSGSGKSTLMNIIGCLDLPSLGEYYFDGKLVNNMDDVALAELRSREISFIFQSFHLLAGKTIFQNVMLPLEYHRAFNGDRSERVIEALTSAHLEKEQWHKSPSLLSGGQRQRAAIARALVTRPRLLLADEPTGNLDSKTGVNVLEELKNLNKVYGTTIVIVTHDDFIAEHVDRVIHLQDGLVLEPKHEF